MLKFKRRDNVKKIAVFVLTLFIAAVIIWLNQERLTAFIDFVRNREAVIKYLDQLGYAGPIVLMALIALQVLIPSLPSEPPMIAGSYVYGFSAGLFMSWIVSATASQAVFYLARYAGRSLVVKLVPPTVLDKWTRKAGEKGTIFFLLAFVIPPIPSDIMTYVAGLSSISGRRFLIANFIGRLPMVVLLSQVGANGLTITPMMLLAITSIGVLMLIFWWYFIIREQSADAPIPSSQSRDPRGKGMNIPSQTLTQSLENSRVAGVIARRELLAVIGWLVPVSTIRPP